MKRFFALFLILSLLLCGCELIPPKTTLPPEDATEAPTAEATQEETEEPTEEETEPETEPAPVYKNPLNGQILEAPFENRIYAFSINNLAEAMPHINLAKADLVFETFVNNSIIRTLGVYTDISQLEAIGPIRSDRIMWNDLALNYDAVVTHASGSKFVLADAAERNVDNINADQSVLSGIVSFRDQDRLNRGMPYDATLFAIGSGIMNYSAEQGHRTTLDPSRQYQMVFADVAVPENGVDAQEFTVTITGPAWTQGGSKPKKDTTMTYDAELGKYRWSQYGKEMVDGLTEEPEAFTNVVILEATIEYEGGMYQSVNYLEGGTGWFCNGGKAERIRWGVNGENEPMWFLTESGETVIFGTGNTYFTFTLPESDIVGIGDSAEE